VVQNATNGFTYDTATQTISFHGAMCDKLKARSVLKVEFLYGCAPAMVL